jgi:predicted RNA-binding protein with PUA-like domain
MATFLVKTEPDTFSINDLKRDKVTSWGGVRNYQARNIIRSMKKGDICLIYHSSCEIPAVVGVGKVVKEAYPDPLQFDAKSEYYDKGSTQDNPRWSAVDIHFVRKYVRPVPLTDMKNEKGLKGFRLLERGNRLSVIEVSEQHAAVIERMQR